MSTMDGLHLKLAKRHLKSFQEESKLMRDHEEAMDCFDCEALLQLGIEAYDWLVRADQAYRKAILLGSAEHNPQVGGERGHSTYPEKLECPLFSLLLIHQKWNVPVFPFPCVTASAPC